MNLGGIANESGVVLRNERISQTAEIKFYSIILLAQLTIQYALLRSKQTTQKRDLCLQKGVTVWKIKIYILYFKEKVKNKNDEILPHSACMRRRRWC